MSVNQELYQQVILEHNKNPRNFGELSPCTHSAEGFNPLCGDHLWLYLDIDKEGLVNDVRFKGEGCAISKASASMMTEYIKGKPLAEVETIFSEFQALVKGELDPESTDHNLGKLKIFSGIWKYPARVKCAALGWHAVNAAIHNKQVASTE